MFPWLVLLTVALAAQGCKKEEVAECGNGRQGLDEECDCGTDPDDLPSSCAFVNGAPGGRCTVDCRLARHENCDNNGIDDDGDGDADCDDADCVAYPTCVPESVCNDLVDNDGDGDIDCDDSDCASLPICGPEDCTDGIDNNEDGFTDCQDAQCIGDPACEGVEVCWNSLDDDGDGYADCDDDDCAGDAVCQPEDCSNGIDDDADLKIDCADRHCIEKEQCAETGCTEADIDHTVTLSFTGQKVERHAFDVSAESDDHYGQCDISNGKEYVIAIDLGSSGRLRVVYEQTGDHNFGFYLKGGPGTGCAAAADRCTYTDVDADGVIELGVLPISRYFLIVSEGILGLGGPVELVFTLADPANPEELCDNLLDDDNDNQTDCGDLQCYQLAGVCDHSACANPADIPTPDVHVGEVGPSTTPMYPMPSTDPLELPYLPLDTRGAGADLAVNLCQGLMGPETLVGFTLTEEAIVQVGFQQNVEDSGDHVMALFFKGHGCELAEHACVDTAGALKGLLQFPGDGANGGRYPPGEYYLAVKALGSAGRINIQIITLDTVAEICEDGGYDNDGDGDANCDDSDCASHHMCIAEDCSDPVADLDGDGKAGCADDDLDDGCGCSLPCAPSPARDYVCDGRYDDQITDYGLVFPPAQFSFSVDTSDPSITDDYLLADCLGSATADEPDYVFFFSLPHQASVAFNFTQPPGVAHNGLFLHADPCRACDDQGPTDEYYIYCYANASPWLQSDLPAGHYALIIKAREHASTGQIMSGTISGTLEITP